MRKISSLFVALLVLAVILAACAPAAAPAATMPPQIVKETVIVEKLVTLTPIPEQPEVTSTEAPVLLPTETPQIAAQKVEPLPLARPADGGCYSAEEVEAKYEEYLNGYFQVTDTSIMDVDVALDETTVPQTCVYAVNWGTDTAGENNHVHDGNEMLSLSNVMAYYIFKQDTVLVRPYMWFAGERYADERSIYEGIKTGGYFVYVTQK